MGGSNRLTQPVDGLARAGHAVFNGGHRGIAGCNRIAELGVEDGKTALDSVDKGAGAVLLLLKLLAERGCRMAEPGEMSFDPRCCIAAGLGVDRRRLFDRAHQRRRLRMNAVAGGGHGVGGAGKRCFGAFGEQSHWWSERFGGARAGSSNCVEAGRAGFGLVAGTGLDLADPRP